MNPVALTEEELKAQKRLGYRRAYAKNAAVKSKRALEYYHRKRAEKIAAGLMPPPKKRGRPRIVDPADNKI